MPVTQINHTGRKRLTSEDVAIGLHNEATPLAFEVARLSLDRHKLPGDALVRLEAYHRTIYARFGAGTISEPVLPGKQSIPQFNIPDGIRFRVKVTSVTEPGKGRLLAAGTGIAPAWIDGGQESLLPVEPRRHAGTGSVSVEFRRRHCPSNQRQNRTVAGGYAGP